MSSDRAPPDSASDEHEAGTDEAAPEASSAEEDVDREAILARRKFFVASAVAGAVLGGASCEGGFFACLKVAADAAAVEGTDAEADAEAAAADAGADPLDAGSTTSGPTRPRDAGSDATPADAGTDAGRDAGKDASAPAPCLRVSPPTGSKPPPQPCLMVLPPKKD